MYVLAITFSGDNPSKLVQDALGRKGVDVIRFDTDRFPWASKLGFRCRSDDFQLTFVDPAGREFALSSIAAVWYRRESAPSLPRTVEPSVHDAAVREVRDFLQCVYAWLEDVPWLDRLPLIERAEHKLLQLRVAAECGLCIPPTVATNNTVLARSFVESLDGPAIVKMLSPVAIGGADNEMTLFTSELQKDDIQNLDGLRFAPMMFQAKVPKRCDLRITIVGERLFAISLDASISSPFGVDWRRIPDPAKYCEPCELPVEIGQNLLRLMHTYGLRYGAVDMILTPGNEYIFLELNPCGDWSWLPACSQSAIAEEIADVLVENCRAVDIDCVNAGLRSTSFS